MRRFKNYWEKVQRPRHVLKCSLFLESVISDEVRWKPVMEMELLCLYFQNRMSLLCIRVEISTCWRLATDRKKPRFLSIGCDHLYRVYQNNKQPMEINRGCVVSVAYITNREMRGVEKRPFTCTMLGPVWMTEVLHLLPSKLILSQKISIFLPSIP